jgi:hypothetical protein
MGAWGAAAKVADARTAVGSLQEKSFGRGRRQIAWVSNAT